MFNRGAKIGARWRGGAKSLDPDVVGKVTGECVDVGVVTWGPLKNHGGAEWEHRGAGCMQAGPLAGREEAKLESVQRAQQSKARLQKRKLSTEHKGKNTKEPGFKQPRWLTKQSGDEQERNQCLYGKLDLWSEFTILCAAG